MQNTREKIVFDDATAFQVLCGHQNQRLKLLERVVGAGLHVRGNEITVEGDGDQVSLAKDVLKKLYDVASKGVELSSDDFMRAVKALSADKDVDFGAIFSDTILMPKGGRPITPKGFAQKRYVDAVRENDIVFAVGPAGTGKTYLAMSLAIRSLLDKEVRRIVLTRPAIEAGERLGFLPGTLEEKVNPYLRPLYDALHEMMDFQKVHRLIEQGVIEVAPLAFMRGRTLNDSFVILDEAQNTTNEQMKMFLTRLGFGSKAIVTGDVTQSDLPRGVRSGLHEAQHILKGVPGIVFAEFTDVDVVRHPLVQEVIRAYARHESHKNRTAPEGD